MTFSTGSIYDPKLFADKTFQIKTNEILNKRMYECKKIDNKNSQILARRENKLLIDIMKFDRTPK